MSCKCQCTGTKNDELKKFIDSIKNTEYSQSHLIEVLHKAQKLYGYLSEATIKFVAKEMGLKVPHVWGVVTFYHYFNLVPQGKYVISVCMGTACYVRGSQAILDVIKEDLGIKAGETTEEKQFTLHETRCVGACALAPVVMINDEVYAKVSKDEMRNILKKLAKN